MIKRTIKLVFAVMLFMSLWLIHSLSADAEVNVNINIGPPPVFAIPAPPEVIVIPGTYVYFVPDIDVDIIFYHGYWYRPHRDHWYRAGSYNGPWDYIVRERMPVVILNLPPDFRHKPPRHSRIPYGHLKKNWSGWEKERHWDDDHRHRDNDNDHEGRGKGKGKEKRHRD
ncbi:MAG: hypothetical protein HY808_14230 [Nitrospirae bacterium]|nr:hypothetical protein [Nitrospirota bacterium]